jgi:methyl-accepting chemotaxis protein
LPNYCSWPTAGQRVWAHEVSKRKLNIAINQLDQVTQQNAAMVEETTAAAHRSLKKRRSSRKQLANLTSKRSE